MVDRGTTEIDIVKRSDFEHALEKFYVFGFVSPERKNPIETALESINDATNKIRNASIKTFRGEDASVLARANVIQYVELLAPYLVAKILYRSVEIPGNLRQEITVEATFAIDCGVAYTIIPCLWKQIGSLSPHTENGKLLSVVHSIGTDSHYGNNARKFLHLSLDEKPVRNPTIPFHEKGATIPESQIAAILTDDLERILRTSMCTQNQKIIGGESFHIDDTVSRAIDKTLQQA